MSLACKENYFGELSVLCVTGDSWRCVGGWQPVEAVFPHSLEEVDFWSFWCDAIFGSRMKATLVGLFFQD